ncbi:DJ-1/PfpI family protein [Pyruvatibacter sp.]|nr:DJ-1/PfpI family protein [Alphaproteobacteria bacterium]
MSDAATDLAPAPLKIGFLMYPMVTALDALGPAQILSAVPGAQMHYIWKEKTPVASDSGYTINPTHDFDDCPQLDVICVPGGFGQVDIMNDEAVLGFLRTQGQNAKYVTAVCTGSLLLGAAGLLDGYEASCHWAWHEQLSLVGATPKHGRVVRDRNRMTGGGVTAGIDFGLTLAAELAGEDVAKLLQLSFEYDPQPPFVGGHPTKAEPATLELSKAFMADGVASMAEAAKQAQANKDKARAAAE